MVGTNHQTAAGRTQPCHLTRGKTSSVCLSEPEEAQPTPLPRGIWTGGSRVKQTQAAWHFRPRFTPCLFNPHVSQAGGAVPSHADPTRPASVAGSDFGPLCTTSTACWCDGGLFLPFRSPDSASFTLLGANLCGSRDNLFLQAGNPSPGRLPHSSTAPTLPPRSVRASPSQILLL